MDQVRFDVSPKDRDLARQIAERAVKLANDTGSTADFLDTFMDVVACHANGCPLRLTDLLEADDFNLAHDVFGIARHIDRETGKLDEMFLPRFSVADVEAPA